MSTTTLSVAIEYGCLALADSADAAIIQEGVQTVDVSQELAVGEHLVTLTNVVSYGTACLRVTIGAPEGNDLTGWTRVAGVVAAMGPDVFVGSLQMNSDHDSHHVVTLPARGPVKVTQYILEGQAGEATDHWVFLEPLV